MTLLPCGGALDVIRAAAGSGLVLPAPAAALGPDVAWVNAGAAIGIAVHEAGHAVFLVLTGQPIVEVRLAITLDDARGHVERGPWAPVGKGVVAEHVPVPSADLDAAHAALEFSAVWGLAGPCASQLLRGSRVAEFGELEVHQAAAAFDVVYGSEQGPLRFWGAWDALRHMLGASGPWAAIEAVAVHLCHFSRLDGATACAIIDAALAARATEARYAPQGYAHRQLCRALGVPLLQDWLEGLVEPAIGTDALLNASRRRAA